MTHPWVAVVALASVCLLLRIAAPLALGNRQPARVMRALALAVPAMLAALVATGAFGDGNRLTLDPRLVGVAAGGAVALAGKSLILTVVVAAAVTTLLRRIV